MDTNIRIKRNTVFAIILCVLAILPTLQAADLQALPMTHITTLAWSPNGTQIAVGRGTTVTCDADFNRYTIQIINTISREVTQNLAGAKCAITALDWSPDSTKLAASSLDDIGIRVWNVQNGHLLMESQTYREGASSIKWRPNDGLQLAYAAYYKNRVGVLDALTGEKISLTPIVGSTLDWSPDGSKLVSGSRNDNSMMVTRSPDDNRIYVTDMMTGQPILILGGNTSSVRKVEWSTNGDKLATIADDLQLWDALSGQLLLSIKIPDISDVKWSPDSQKLATTSFDGNVQVWDAFTGQLLESFIYGSGLQALAWSPDGMQIVYGGYAIDKKEPQIEIIDVQRVPTSMLKATATLTP
jgi:WD40 repeat protein